MLSFTHADPGTSVAVWNRHLDIPSIPPLDFAEIDTVVVIAAHPDDETLAAGGLLAASTTAQRRILVVIATDGEGSHPNSTTHAPERLAHIRRHEAERAVATVAPTARLVMLHLPDGQLSDHEHTFRASLGRLLAAVGSRTLIVAPWEADGHPDHEAAGRVARMLADATGSRLLQYPIWAWHWAAPGDEAIPANLLRSLPLTPSVVAGKRAALRQYRSQLEPLGPAVGDEPVVPSALLEFFDQPYELYVEVESPASETLKQSFFDGFYGEHADPWQFDSRWYEKRKRALTMASLPRPRFRTAFEPGCSVGALTAELAQRCDKLRATDVAAAPLGRARQRLAHQPHVEFEQLSVPDQWPAEQFDLVVISEIGYYFGGVDLDRLVELSVQSLTPDGVLVVCHWRHPVPEYPQTGDEVHRQFRQYSGLEVLASHVETDFLLDVLVPTGSQSVAAREGLV